MMLMGNGLSCCEFCRNPVICKTSRTVAEDQMSVSVLGKLAHDAGGSGRADRPENRGPSLRSLAATVEIVQVAGVSDRGVLAK